MGGLDYARTMKPLNAVLWTQLDAALVTLRNAIEAASPETWTARCGNGEFWLAAFHALFFLDLYATGVLEGFEPPAPFEATELDEDARPSRVYTREELLTYLSYGRDKGKAQIEALTDTDLERTSDIPWFSLRSMSVVEAIIYNTRHVQHHAAQLNLILRQAEDRGSDWVFGPEATA